MALMADSTPCLPYPIEASERSSLGRKSDHINFYIHYDIIGRRVYIAMADLKQTSNKQQRPAAAHSVGFCPAIFISLKSYSLRVGLLLFTLP